MMNAKLTIDFTAANFRDLVQRGVHEAFRAEYWGDDMKVEHIEDLPDGSRRIHVTRGKDKE